MSIIDLTILLIDFWFSRSKAGEVYTNFIDFSEDLVIFSHHESLTQRSATWVIYFYFLLQVSS